MIYKRNVGYGPFNSLLLDRIKYANVYSRMVHVTSFVCENWSKAVTFMGLFPFYKG